VARFRKRSGEAVVSLEHQETIFDRLDQLTRKAEASHPGRPAVRLFCIVLAMMGLGLILQASHSATIQTGEEFHKEITQQAMFRVIALGVLILGYRIGPVRLRPLLPLLVVASAFLLVACWIPGLEANKNGSHRWINLVGLNMTLQPSEVARAFLVLWVADRCTRLGPRLLDLRQGVFPILAVGMLFVALIGLETDLGGALVFLTVFLFTWFVGGASFAHFTGSIATIGGAALLLAVTSVDYIRTRLEVFLGHATNEQVSSSIEALGSGKLLGNGLGHGLWRNSAMPYQDSDYIFALVGEELGFFGMAVCIGLILAFVWFSLRLVITIRDRYSALAAFGLLLSVGLQAMIHMQVVTGLAPPKGMTLPFMSDGGTSLVVSSLAVGLALGAARAEQSPSRDSSSTSLSQATG
jgi:cell division protein FtsW